ncbi:MAG: tRNA (adenine-N1)-methyltransferase [Thermoplasmata archaeon]|nr:tRNA (adenine-N1)-methyltransferase [Thermoplasmata archaeon]
MVLDYKLISKMDRVMLIETAKPTSKILVKVAASKSASPEKIKGLGVFSSGKLIGMEYGTSIEIGRRKFLMLRPSILDKLDTLQRKAQIITAKDSAVISLHCDVKSGDTIIEGGLGSGALTLVLANLVRPDGKVITYETSPINMKVGLNNLKNAGLDKFVVVKHQDITRGITEENIDAVILDIPEPWHVVEHAYKILKAGGHFSSYSPTINQVETTINELRNNNFTQPYTLETLQREIVVGTGGTRPSFEMLGHTGYLTFARKIL